MKLFGLDDSIESSAVITPWSLIHVLSGYVIYVIAKRYIPGISFKEIIILCFVIHTLYEVKDLVCYNDDLFFALHGKKLIDTASHFWDHSNSLANSIGDTVFAFIGTALGPILAPRVTNSIVFNTIIIFIATFTFFIHRRYG